MTYIKRFGNLLGDQRMCEIFKNAAFLNFVVNQEKCIDTLFKNLVDRNSMPKEMPKSIILVAPTPSTMY